MRVLAGYVIDGKSSGIHLLGYTNGGQRHAAIGGHQLGSGNVGDGGHNGQEEAGQTDYEDLP